jgi:hypothetical protein
MLPQQAESKRKQDTKEKCGGNVFSFSFLDLEGKWLIK